MSRLTLGFIAVLALGLGACGSDNPKPVIVDGAVTDGAVADAPTGDGGLDGAADAANCVSDGGCYTCAAETTSQFLNHCTTGQCFPFDNEARLPLYNHGNLPPAP
jgi:hypothetical protein